MALRAVPNPEPSGRWTWEAARAHTRAIRISAHPEMSLVTLSLWREDTCVGSLRLSPSETSALVAKLTGALAELAVEPLPERRDDAPDLTARVSTIEARLKALEEAAGA